MFGTGDSRRWMESSKITAFSTLLLCTTSLLLSLDGTSAIPRHFMGKWYGRQLRRDWIADQILGTEPEDPLADQSPICDDKTKITLGYFNQTLDHFGDGTNSKVAKNGYWQQYYQINDRFFNKRKNGDTPVIFLMIGGEGPILTKWVCNPNYTYMTAAAKYNAKVIQLEHRFFGRNKDLKDMSVDSLQYLTTEQALADINKFIQDYNAQNKWTAPKWVAFGGSYPGTIAARLRQVYPNITQGNVASSAPMFATVDFWQYAYVMENTIKSTSQACYDSVKAAFKYMVNATLTEAGRDELNKEFSLIPPLETKTVLKEDLDTVTSTIFSAFQGIIQYTYDGANDMVKNKTGDNQQTISRACQIMTDPKTKGKHLQRLYNVFLLESGADANFSSSYADSNVDFINTDLNGPGADMRGRPAITRCLETLYPSVYISNNALTCSSGKLNATQIYNRVTNTLQQIGRPEDFNATNVFLPNGAFDPWSSLGVPDEPDNKNRADHLVTRLTPESAHCSDMYPYYKGEPAGLKATRDMFFKEVDYYVNLDSVFGSNNGAASIGFSLVLFVVSAYFGFFN
ncbi:hypothetical protein M3Y97_00165900 [Aphelenchoides bicaudatus]|nr:hypothetical protein M3Y97_00165900 [Aphelenchoides bicaudatus]